MSKPEPPASKRRSSQVGFSRECPKRWCEFGGGRNQLSSTRRDFRKARARNSPAPANADQTRTDRGSGVSAAVVSVPVPVFVLDEELSGDWRAIETPGVCETS